MSAYRQKFLARVRKALANSTLQGALDYNTIRRKNARLQAYASLPQPFETMRERAHAIRSDAVDHLAAYLDEFIRNIEKNGVQVHHAGDGAEACAIVLEIARRHQAKTVVKSKSMVSEEIHLNPALEGAGLRVVETDLGEFIVQLRGEPPAHIITPAVHLRREDVGRTFAEKLGVPYTTDVKEMNNVARHRLRQMFLNAEIGISGVNMAVAETGTLCLCTNEGNGRMCTTIPPVHIALMGLERLVPHLEDLAHLLQLLPRSATGQKLTNYVSLIQGPRRPEEDDGAQERHLIILDNGRTAMAGGPFKEALDCIRCGACLNVCPVFREIGGHAYASPYPGPIGALISSEFFGRDVYGHLAKASSLCGACAEACPVGIDFTTLLLRRRDEYVRQVPQPLVWRVGMKMYAWTMRHAWAYRLVQSAAAIGLRLLPARDGWVRWMSPPASAWTEARDFPPFAAKPFHARFRAPTAKPDSRTAASALTPTQFHTIENKNGVQPQPAARDLPPAQKFAAEWQALEGVFIRCTAREVPEKLLAELAALPQKTLLTWDFSKDEMLPNLAERLRAAGYTLLDGKLPPDNPARLEKIQAYAAAPAGLSGALAALADSGTLVIPSGNGRPLLASLLPPIHIAILREGDIYPDMQSWIAAGGRQTIANAGSLALVSGPSRTADIEMTLTIGVHGPGKAVVICYSH